MTEALTRGRITRGGILRGGVAAGGILRSQRQGSPYAFNLDLSTFKDTVTGRSLSCNIDGTRYDEVNGVTTAFGTDVPTIADKGLRICGAYSNLLYYSSDLTQANWLKQEVTPEITVDNVSVGISRINFTLDNKGVLQAKGVSPLGTLILFSAKLKSESVNGTVNIEDGGGFVAGVAIVCNVTTDWNRFTTPSGTTSQDNKLISMWINKRTEGLSSCLVQECMMVSKKYYHPYIPTTTSPISSPSEAGNSGTGTGIWIDDVASNFPLLNTALTSQGTLTFKWKTGFNVADVSGNLNILSFDGTTNSISYDADNNLIKITDGTNTASKALTVVADTEYTIQATWGLVSGSPKMAIAVNGTAGSQADFTGTFTPSDIYFGLENEELQYIKDFMVYKEATWL